MDAIEFRRHLHRHPELSFEEFRTAEFISSELTQLGIEHHPIAKTGVLARIEGRGNLKRAIVLRADIDALPIHEQAEVEWRSENEGVMHACGHDIHAAVLYGVLKQLSATRDFDGTIFGLFQPGEECNPGGASLVLEEHPFDGYDIAAVIGEHAEPQLEVGTLGFRAGKYMASSDELRFSVCGIGGHAAQRAKIRDAVSAAADLTLQLTAMNSDEQVVSIGRVTADGATNVIPDNVALEGTMRTFDESLRNTIKSEIARKASEVDARWGTTTVVDISQGYPCVVNNAKLTRAAQQLAATKYRTEELAMRTTAEDFGFYCGQYPSLFYRLGVGAAAGRAHTATYCPDERAIDIGVDFMESLARKILKL